MAYKHAPKIIHTTPSDKSIQPPKLNGPGAVKTLAGKLNEPVNAIFTKYGDVRTLEATDLFEVPFAGDPEQYARDFIASDRMVKALKLRAVTIVPDETVSFPAFTRVGFRQVLRGVPGIVEDIPVRGGYVHVYVDNEGKIFTVNSTLRRGTKPRALKKLISKDAAITAAKAALGESACDVQSCQLVISAHDWRLDPVYEVNLTVCQPRKQRLFLVKARTGEVVYQANNMFESQVSRSSKGTRRPKAPGSNARSFLKIPDYGPDSTVTKLALKVMLDKLPNPKLLANERYDMKVLNKGEWETVKANAQGTFEFDPLSKDPLEVSKFSAVITFFWLNTQDVLYEGLGGVKVPRAIPVFMDDPDVQDNAYFDPMAWEIHMGIGTGVKEGGLAIHISWDPGVGCHENGHKRVAAQTPGKDLPGPQGSAAHEGWGGDDIGDLWVDFMMQIIHADTIGKKLTVQDVVNDPRIIGKYAMPPHGIRCQKNDKKAPDDLVGEPHDDGLIIGGAASDLMVAMVQAGTDDTVRESLEDWMRMQLAALAMVPAHKVTFSDILKACLTADKKLFAGKNAALITKAFGDHGIVLASSTTHGGKKGKKGGSRGKGKTGSGKSGSGRGHGHSHGHDHSHGHWGGGRKTA